MEIITSCFAANWELYEEPKPSWGTEHAIESLGKQLTNLADVVTQHGTRLAALESELTYFKGLTRMISFLQTIEEKKDKI